MYRSYFKIMLRNMIKQKFYSAITMLGLTVGITFALLTGIFIWGELQVNTDLKDVDRLYLLETHYKTNEGNSRLFLYLLYWVRQRLSSTQPYLKTTIAFVIGL